MALVIKQNSVSLYSDMMDGSYPYVTWKNSQSPFEWEARSTEGSEKANVTGTLTVDGDTRTCTFLITAMDTGATLEFGDAYNGEYGWIE